MSLEKALEANTKALLENAEATREQTELLKSRLSGGTAKTTEKPAAKEEPKEEKPKAADKKPAAKKTTAKKDEKKADEVTAESLRERYQQYMLGAPKGSDERKARIDRCREVLAHFEVEGVSDIAEENFDEAVGYIEKLENGEELSFGDADGGEEEEDELPI